MIQRIQTVFLSLMIACLCAFLFLPIWGKVNTLTGETHTLNALGHEYILANNDQINIQYFPFVLIGIVTIIIITISILEILQYKNRLLQMKLGMLNSILLVVVLGLICWFIYSGQKEWLPTISGVFGFGVFMPAIAMVFNRLAIRYIKKDEDLVRSVDRVR